MSFPLTFPLSDAENLPAAGGGVGRPSATMLLSYFSTSATTVATLAAVTGPPTACTIKAITLSAVGIRVEIVVRVGHRGKSKALTLCWILLIKLAISWEMSMG